MKAADADGGIVHQIIVDPNEDGHDIWFDSSMVMLEAFAPTATAAALIVIMSFCIVFLVVGKAFFEFWAYHTTTAAPASNTDVAYLGKQKLRSCVAMPKEQKRKVTIAIPQTGRQASLRFGYFHCIYYEKSH